MSINHDSNFVVLTILIAGSILPQVTAIQADNDFAPKRFDCSRNEKYVADLTCKIKPLNRTTRLLVHKLVVIKEIPEMSVSTENSTEIEFID